VDLTIESYDGISLEVVYTVTAEMVYQGSMIKYPVKDTQTIKVQNFYHPTQKDLARSIPIVQVD